MGAYMSLRKLQVKYIRSTCRCLIKRVFEELVIVLYVRDNERRQTALSALWEREAHSTTGSAGYAVPMQAHQIPNYV